MTVEKHVTYAVAVPSYRRPQQLRDLLPRLVAQLEAVQHCWPEAYSGEILVVDNDPDSSAREVVEQQRGPLRYVSEPEPGISAVRNRALDEATTDLLVMLDDDERPEPGWLAALLSTWRTSRAALVSGRVQVAFQGELDPWVEAGGFFARRNLPTGTPITVASSNNWLLDLAQVRERAVRFEARFGLSGGEDTLFSRLLQARGGRLVWCAESVVTDLVPATRMSRRWVLARALSHGNSTALVAVALAPTRPRQLVVRLLYAGRGGLRVVAGAARYLLGCLRRSDRHQARGARTAMRGAGMVGGACGYVHQEYSRS